MRGTLRRVFSISGLLLGVDFLDEAAGVGSVGAPEIQGEFGISYATASLILFTLPMLAGLLLEPPVYLLADRLSRKGFVVGGLGVMGVMLLVCGLATGPWVLAGGISVWAVGSGVGVGLAQATLMDAHPEDREHYMTRWVMMGALGDLATPILVAGLAMAAMGWREAFLAVGAATLAYTALLATRAFPDVKSGEDEASLSQAFKAAVKNRKLLGWLLGSSLTVMLDEILIAFGALHLGRSLGANVIERGVLLASLIVGIMIGLKVTEVLLARGVAPMTVLRWSSAACVLAFVCWLAAPTLEVSLVLGVLVGAFTGPQYPIVMAQAYRALPGHSGMVNAMGVAFMPIEVVLPLMVGVVADQFGLVAALSLLLLQPIGLLLLTTSER